MDYYNGFLRDVRDALALVQVDGTLPDDLEGPYYLLGNGGSAAVAAHICNDINKSGRLAYVPDYATLTCFANDYSWTGAMERWVNNQALGTVILISSSGQSANIRNAANIALANHFVITLSGFNEDNKLRQLGHVNYWVPSRNYGVVEITHLAILHGIFNPG